MDRVAELKVLQDEYKDFTRFVFVCMTSLLGFSCTWMQLAIATFLQHGPLYRMIMAQRGEAKTTITAMYAVWRLIHDPRTRVLVVSATEKKSKEIAGWIIQIIKYMPELQCLLPAADDRSAITSFDVHNELKGPEKSPSIACLPIKGGMSGSRADVLIADDIETPVNSLTEVQRELLRFLSKEFSSINAKGDIIYLGTPQSVDSVYNSLPSRGFTIRVWPGRYPTLKEEEHYGDMLCPVIKSRMVADPSLREGGGVLGDRGKPTDPVMMDEEALQAKENDQGPEVFQLQYMLDTRLLDAHRYPLKPEMLVLLRPPAMPPVSVNFVQSEDKRQMPPQGFPIGNTRLYRAASVSDETCNWKGTHFYIDPAGGGQNGDETGWAVTRAAGPYIWLLAVGGIPGGTDDAALTTLVDTIVKYKPNSIGLEKNFGHGMFATILMPRLLAVHKCTLVEPWSSTQKELRIINTLEPLLGGNQLIVHPDVFEMDWAGTMHYPAAMRSSYSFLYQLSRLTRQKGALIHDDRLDAVAGACQYWINMIKVDKKKAAEAARMSGWRERYKDALGTGRTIRTHNHAPRLTSVRRLMG